MINASLYLIGGNKALGTKRKMIVIFNLPLIEFTNKFKSSKPLGDGYHELLCQHQEKNMKNNLISIFIFSILSFRHIIDNH